MAWQEVSTMSARREFAALARKKGANVRQLCRRFGISPTTGYKWIARSRSEGETFDDRSRRPHKSPNKTEPEVESALLAIRDQYPDWNARKIRRVAQTRGVAGVPVASTVGEILKRNGRITEDAAAAAHRWNRFEHEQPNDLSQIDFKGHFALGNGTRCYPLTMIDDHSRYAQILHACVDERTEPVKALLTAAFRRYGLPWAMNMDNGNPWGNPTGDPFTRLTVWLIRLGISISHSRPLHPQTNGKDERFNGTLKRELLRRRSFATLSEAQKSFDAWREVYNHTRPHEGIDLQVPAQRYSPSTRSFPETLPPLEYASTDRVVKVWTNGTMRTPGGNYSLSEAFAGELVALRPTTNPDEWDVYYAHKHLAKLDYAARTITRARRKKS
jgi:transposase InsO family protein